MVLSKLPPGRGTEQRAEQSRGTEAGSREAQRQRAESRVERRHRGRFKGMGSLVSTAGECSVPWAQNRTFPRPLWRDPEIGPCLNQKCDPWSVFSAWLLSDAEALRLLHPFVVHRRRRAHRRCPDWYPLCTWMKQTVRSIFRE